MECSQITKKNYKITKIFLIIPTISLKMDRIFLTLHVAFFNYSY